MVEASEKKLDTLEEEMKLLKGELKQSLASVRDYLLNMELPSSEFSTILAALSTDSSGTQKISIDGNIANTRGKEPDETSAEETTEEVTEEEIVGPEDELNPEDDDIFNQDAIPEDESETSPEDDLADQEETFNTEPGLVAPEESMEESPEEHPEEYIEDDTNNAWNELQDIGHRDEAPVCLSESGNEDLSLEEDPLMEYENINADLQQSTPKVNLLANLINWVAKAKKEIGSEQISTFLEVYGISGHLSPELKEAILHLTEITDEQSEDSNRAEIWSQSILSLHGILTGGDAPLHPIQIPLPDVTDEVKENEEEIIEVDKPKDKPVKLKLVFPSSDGEDKEYCVDLTPDVDSVVNS